MLNVSGAPKVDPDHPWLGLSSFSYETRDYFFGRTAEIKEIYQRVTEHPLTVLYGQAGYGKTSLLGAGLLPQLESGLSHASIHRLRFGEGEPPLIVQLRSELGRCFIKDHDLLTIYKDLPDWTLECLRAQLTSPSFEKENPEKMDIKRLLMRVNGLPMEKLLKFNEETLWQLTHLKLNAQMLAAYRPVLIIDQFEEIFTLADTRSRREEVRDFFTQLADVVENRPPAALEERFRSDRALARQYDLSPSPLRVVLTLREDYLSHLEAWKKTMPSLMRNRMALKLLSGPQALEAVVKPGRLEGRNLVSDEVGAQIVRFVAKRDRDTPLNEIEAVPPLLSLLCDELNTARLNHKPEPLAQITAELVAEQGTDILQNFYTRCFEGYPPELRHFVEDRLLTTGGHRIPVAHEDAVEELGKHAIAPEALTTLVQRRLLTQEERGGLQRLEIVHDKIAELAVASREKRKERDAKERAERETREALEREVKARKERRRLRWFAAAMAFFTLLSVAGLIVGWKNYRRAEAEAKRAEAAESDQARMGFEASFSNARVLEKGGNCGKIIEILTPYLIRPELRSNPNFDAAKKLVDESKEHIAFNLEARKKFLAHEAHIAFHLGNDAILELVQIPAGQFLMGSSDNKDDEKQHPVTISKPFYMGKFMVTEAQFETVMGKNPSAFDGATNPVDTVSWFDAEKWCQQVSEMLSARLGTKVVFELPTEAQWEYACRAGTKTRYHSGDDETDLARAGWYDGNSDRKSHPVGRREPNAFGLYDMHGNVWQWCRDGYTSDYEALAAIDPFNNEAPARVLRGGSFFNEAKACRSSFRFKSAPTLRKLFCGFRCVLILDR